MKPQELRIGNLFYRINRSGKIHLPVVDFPFKVVALPFSHVLAVGINENPAQVKEWSDIHYSDMSPVPIGDDWIYRLGFQSSTFNWSKGEFRISKTNGKYNLGFGGVMLLRENLEYVHQLQNLYYCLVGKELTVNE